jgi:septum formation protein
VNKYILASASPRRSELLQRIGIEFEVIPSNVEEDIEKDISPKILVQELALIKAADVAKNVESGYLVIGADTLVIFNDNVLGKPKDEENAYKMLSLLSGKTHRVYTGICVIDTESGKSVSDFECSKVTFRELTDDEIYAYIETGEPMDKAGAYGIQEKGALLVEEIKGDYFNIVGFPICKFGELLKNEFDIRLI